MTTATRTHTGTARMSKAQLVAVIERDPAFVWSAYPPAKWSKDELVDYYRQLHAS